MPSYRWRIRRIEHPARQSGRPWCQDDAPGDGNLTALKDLRQDTEACSDDDSVFGLSESQISRRVASMARAAGLGEGYSGHSGRVGLAIRMTRRGAPLQAVQTHGRWKSPAMPRYIRGEKALEALEWLV